MANTQVTTKGQIDTVRGALDKMKPQLALALPKHLTPDRLLRVAMTAVQQTPKLLDCDRTSLYSAVMTCAQLGLEPDGVLGQAYLVPFKGKVQFIAGYKGYIRLAFNSGEIRGMNAQAVREGDDFSYAYGLDEHLHHVPADDNDDARITHFYAYAKFKDGGHVFVVLPRSKVDKIRDKSEAYQAFKRGQIKSTPWDEHYEPMGCKSAIRALAKYLPLSVQRAAEVEEAYERGKHADIDEYGGLVIEGAANEDEASDQKQQSEDKPGTKMNDLAGSTEPPDDSEPQVPDQTKNAYHKRYVVNENADIMVKETGEIVPGKYVTRHDDGTFSVDEKQWAKDCQQDTGQSDKNARGAGNKTEPTLGLFGDDA
ncbi:MAG: recombinase RecT [Pseudomonadales bacterium]